MVKDVEAALVLDLEVECRHVSQQLDDLQVVLSDGVVQGSVAVHILTDGGQVQMEIRYRRYRRRLGTDGD